MPSCLGCALGGEIVAVLCCRASSVLGACLKRKRQASWGQQRDCGRVHDRTTGHRWGCTAAATEAPPVGGPAGGVGEWGTSSSCKLPKAKLKLKLELWKQNKFFHQAAAGSPIKTPDRDLLVPKNNCHLMASRASHLSEDPKETAGACLRDFGLFSCFPCQHITDHGSPNTEAPSIPPPSSSSLIACYSQLPVSGGASLSQSERGQRPPIGSDPLPPCGCPLLQTPNPAPPCPIHLSPLHALRETELRIASIDLTLKHQPTPQPANGHPDSGNCLGSVLSTRVFTKISCVTVSLLSSK